MKFHSQMTNEERYSLIKRLAKPIISKKTDIYNKVNIYETPKTIKYSTSRIKDIIKKYEFPGKFNFIDEENPTVHIKNQEDCGSCWAFAATTALSYRFHKLGIDVDLSPQYLLSCYINDCDKGDQIIDTHLYLVKNGTTSEGCAPYSSGKGKITEKCPTKCKNGEVFTKYYSENAYSIEDEYFNEENYYDIVTVIIDQLINYGPVTAGINLYLDFYKLNEKKYSNIIYRYDETSDYYGGHAIVIVGYGFENEKFYWIIQNSWGETFGVNGFAKIEFGQIGIERISFSDPYIKKNSTEKEINVKLQFRENCKFKFDIDENNSEEDYFEMTFIGVDSAKDNFYYQCSVPKIKDKNEGICTYQVDSLFNPKGYYKFKDYQSLKKNNVFNFEFSGFQQNQIYFYGIDYIDSIFSSDLYISEKGSKILLYFEAGSEDERFISNIYPNINSKQSLSDCVDLELYRIGLYFSLILCDIKNNELEYFKSSSNNQSLVYDIFCGEKEEMLTKVHILDKEKYPVFIIKKMVYPKNLDSKSTIVVTAKIEGSISHFKKGNYFGVYSIIQSNNKNYFRLIVCYIPMPSKVENNFEINCLPSTDSKQTFYDSNLIVLPYPFPIETTCPFEVMFDENNSDDEGSVDEDLDDDESFKRIRASSKFININFLLFMLPLLALLLL